MFWRTWNYTPDTSFLTHVPVDISWYLLLKTIPQHKHWTHLSSTISKITTVEAIIRLETGNKLNVFKTFYVRRIFRGNMLLETDFILMLWVSSNEVTEMIYNCMWYYSHKHCYVNIILTMDFFYWWTLLWRKMSKTKAFLTRQLSWSEIYQLLITSLPHFISGSHW